MNNLLLTTAILIGVSSTTGALINESINIAEKGKGKNVTYTFNCYTYEGIYIKKTENICEKKLNSNQLNSLLLDEITIDEKVVMLSKPFVINYFNEQNYLIARDENLGVYCWGSNVNELQKHIQENINILFKMYLYCDINELSEDAQVLRNKLGAYIN